MTDYPAPQIRNLAIVGHASAGKTMLVESMLVCAQQLGRLGSINQGTTASDFHDSEHDHGISVHASLLAAEWAGTKLNLLDTPGYQDFRSEALSGLRSLTGSSGTHTETLVGYEKVPHELEAEIIAEAQIARA